MLYSTWCQKNIACLEEMVCFFPNFPCLPCLPGTSEFNLKILCNGLLALWASASEFISLWTFPFFFFFPSIFITVFCHEVSQILLGRKRDINTFRKKTGICLVYNTEVGNFTWDRVYERTRNTEKPGRGGVFIGGIWLLQRCEFYQPWRKENTAGLCFHGIFESNFLLSWL